MTVDMFKSKTFWVVFICLGLLVWIGFGVSAGFVISAPAHAFFSTPLRETTVGQLCVVLVVAGFWFGK